MQDSTTTETALPTKRPAPTDDPESFSEGSTAAIELPKPKRVKISHKPVPTTLRQQMDTAHSQLAVPLPYALLSALHETKLTIEKERRKLDRIELKLDLIMSNFGRAYELEQKVLQSENELAELRKWRAVAVEVMGDLMKAKTSAT